VYELKDVMSEVKDFVRLGQDSPQHKFNESIEKLDEQSEEMPEKFDEMGDDASKETRVALDSLRANRDAVRKQIVDLKEASDCVERNARIIGITCHRLHPTFTDSNIGIAGPRHARIQVGQPRQCII